jgi:SpoVK/Ycf46/Vps4 family AAA+-type ATPase
VGQWQVSCEVKAEQRKMNDYKRFEELVKSDYSCISIVTYEEQYALEIIRDTAMKLNRDMWLWSIVGGVRDGLIADSPTITDTENPAVGLANMAGAQNGAICVTLDLGEHLKSGLAPRMLRDIIVKFDKSENTLVMIDSEDRLPQVVKAYTRTFEISLPDYDELKSIVKNTLSRFHRKTPIEVGITKTGMDIIIRNLRGLTRRQAEKIIKSTVVEDRRFDDNDVNVVIANKRRMLLGGGLLEFIQTPIDLNEIGGMESLKRWLKNRKNAFDSKAEDFGIKAPRGVLMLGVQGAGKSLCAKAVATAWHQPLLKLDPSSLYNSYIGESERSLRHALRQVEMMSPVILWIDEVEKGFASAASQSTDGGLSKRMFGTLLTWMQEHEEPVFLIATANDIEALPPELLRKGRFDEIFFVDLPEADTRKKIFEIHLKKRKRDPNKFDLDALAKTSEGYSGAEIEQAVISALHDAYSSNKGLNTNIILNSLRTSPPLSVTMAEKVRDLRQWAKGRCVPAD